LCYHKTHSKKNTVRSYRAIIERYITEFGDGPVDQVFVLEKHQAIASLSFTANALNKIAPFFLLAVLFAAYAKASGAEQLIARAFSGKTTAAIFAASLAGTLSPFCSCGVIPVIAGMLASGVPLAPEMAFYDGSVKSPISALRFNPRHCGVRLSTLPAAPAIAVFSGFASLDLGAFYGTI
jgi:hypothetical protein